MQVYFNSKSRQGEQKQIPQAYPDYKYRYKNSKYNLNKLNLTMI